jgi:hypothetical protein
MEDTITVYGKIYFEPEDKTKKHKSQSSWKRIAMVNFNHDLSSYYAWFINKRFNLELNKPLRGAHISFINDSIKDLTQDGKITLNEANQKWESVKRKWNKQVVPIKLELTPKFNKKHWWLSLDNDSKQNLLGIRAELGLKNPFWDFHMTIGVVNEKNAYHNEYIQNGIIRGFIP